MPDRPLRIAGYAAGASLAAITLVYVFGPTFFLDDEAANSSRASRKKGVVGLVNPANDCFINSVLQVLAGLPELRLYLIREMHRRKLDGPEMYEDLTAAVEEQRRKKESKPKPGWLLLGQQQGLVTAGLKEVLDALNERPIYKKTISAQSFIRVVEQAFKTRINRTQQDAQEFMQIILERLAEEHHAGRRARRWAAKEGIAAEPRLEGGVESQDTEKKSQPSILDIDSTSPVLSRDDQGSSPVGENEQPKSNVEVTPPSNADEEEKDDEDDDEPGSFPLEGRQEWIVECSYCHFKPRPRAEPFVTLPLHTPPGVSSTTLNTCFDGLFKQEHLDDFLCDRCRLEHALQLNARQLSKTSLSDKERNSLEEDKLKLETALRDDPEKPPKDVKLPDRSTVPKRQTSKHMQISRFPRVLALHLTRSIFADSYSSKNTVKVAIPETLSLGGLLDRKTYRLLGTVTHKGGHNSGHYETFRRQYLSPPFSTPASMGTEGIFSSRPSPAPSPRVSAAPSPRLNGRNSREADSPQSSASQEPQLLSTPSLDSPTSSSASSKSLTSLSAERQRPPPPTSVPIDAIPTPGLPTLPPERQKDSTSTRPQSSGYASVAGRSKRKMGPDRWWRISDDKIKECKTSDVLNMQREVYLLFYEMIEG